MSKNNTESRSTDGSEAITVNPPFPNLKELIGTGPTINDAAKMIYSSYVTDLVAHDDGRKVPIVDARSHYPSFDYKMINDFINGQDRKWDFIKSAEVEHGGYCTLFRDKETEKCVFCIIGLEDYPVSQTVKDLLPGACVFLGRESLQTPSLMNKFKEWQAEHNIEYVIGQSLGTGPATYIGALTGLKTYLIEPAGTYVDPIFKSKLNKNAENMPKLSSAEIEKNIKENFINLFAFPNIWNLSGNYVGAAGGNNYFLTPRDGKRPSEIAISCDFLRNNQLHSHAMNRVMGGRENNSFSMEPGKYGFANCEIGEDISYAPLLPQKSIKGAMAQGYGNPKSYAWNSFKEKFGEKAPEPALFCASLFCCIPCSPKEDPLKLYHVEANGEVNLHRETSEKYFEAIKLQEENLKSQGMER